MSTSNIAEYKKTTLSTVTHNSEEFDNLFPPPPEDGAVYNTNKNATPWYTCENNHPFTTGNCGIAIATAKCYCGGKIVDPHKLVQEDTTPVSPRPVSSDMSSIIPQLPVFNSQAYLTEEVRKASIGAIFRDLEVKAACTDCLLGGRPGGANPCYRYGCCHYNIVVVTDDLLSPAERW